VYFNNTLICTLKNHQRLSYKFFSEGFLIIDRKYKKKSGPNVSFAIEKGKSYGVRIEEPYPQALDPNKKYRLTSTTNIQDFNSFMENEFNKLKPYKEDDFILQEDPKNVIITE